MPFFFVEHLTHIFYYSFADFGGYEAYFLNYNYYEKNTNEELSHKHSELRQMPGHVSVDVRFCGGHGFLWRWRQR